MTEPPRPSKTSPPIVLEARNLSVTFKGRAGFALGGEPVRALDSVSFSLPRGGALAVIGESGSGKTTLMRAILGLASPSSGSVELWGRSVGAMTTAERMAARRRCGYVLQDPYSSIPPTLTVMEAVTEPWRVVHGRAAKEEGKARARALLAETRLPENLWNARARYFLSGGQRQRVAIARALILSPEILLCDEPTAMQDVSTRGEVLDVLRKRTEAGMSMIIVTHDLLLARKAAERGLVLHEGRAVEAGLTSDLLERPSREYTKALIAALPRISSNHSQDLGALPQTPPGRQLPEPYSPKNA